ncbi:hypothetical protein UFOVP609_29 [uncultured Caudovirales phage]|uniref:Uncharacterized protein n=1 Tax=uncultured Caudovirales phage TaxID=2100421 RepID=A0A6J5N144_9CAUD|nr:hypothetical protein UFOVP609_29 [uncultured Caudovirales phage]
MNSTKRKEVVRHMYYVLAETVIEMANNASDPDEEKILVAEAEKLLRKASPLKVGA